VEELGEIAELLDGGEKRVVQRGKKEWVKNEREITTLYFLNY